MANAGILDNVLLIRSWCANFYSDYFSDQDYIPRIKTRDIDFLTTARPSFPNKVDFEDLLSHLGFEVNFFGEGYMKLESEELILEFLTPEVGRARGKPVPIKDLKFNAQPLRHLSMLWRDPIKMIIADVKVRLPHPADYMFQKLISSSKRKRSDKALKDREIAIEVLRALLEKDEKQSITDSLNNLSRAERKLIMQELCDSEYSKVIEELV